MTPVPRFIPTLPSDRKHLPLLAALSVLLIGLLLIFNVLNTVVKVDGDSMFPTLHNGDRVLVSRGYDVAQRGDIISFAALIDGRRDTLIKRVVALGGDTVEVIGDTVVVNGIKDAETYPVLKGSGLFRIAPFRVPAGTVYVMGDNRPVSLDSRFFGPVYLSDIRGEARYIFSPVTRFRRIDETAGRP